MSSANLRSQTEASTSNRRHLGLTSATLLVIANMIGAGLFTTSGFALADLGDKEWVLAAWAVGGALAMCGALCYGALARYMPESGGEYLFLSRTVHPLAGFLAGWISLLAGFTAPIAAAALALQAYLTASFSIAAWQAEWIGSSAIVAAGLIHGVNLRWGVWIQNVTVAVKVALITVFIVMGAVLAPQTVEGTESSTDSPELSAFAMVLIWISFAYSGWNAAVYIGGEVRNPQRNLLRALLLATAVVTVIYLALNAVFLYSVPAAELIGKAEVGAIAAHALGGATLQQGISALLALALFTSILSMVMTGPRVYARMAEDGLFPPLFAAQNKVPTAAIVLQVTLALSVVWVSELAQLLSYIGFTLSLSAAATVGGLIAVRHRIGAEELPVPGYPWIPALFIGVTLATAGFMVVRQPMIAGTGLLTILLGVLFYWLARRTLQR